MKNYFICMIAFLISSLPVFGQDFYDINTISTIEITFQEENWDFILDSLVANGQEERLLGSVAINGQFFDSVGVRYKGNSSYSPDRVKNPLNIKLDYVIDDQLIDNYGTLKLANVFKDPSFVREVLSYEIARKYFPASKSNFAKVYINGTYLGLYTSNQDVDKYFMRTHFASDENPRFKGEISGNARPGEMGGVWLYLGADSSSYFDRYQMESDYGWQDLVAFLDSLNNYPEYVDHVLNVDRHLWFLAFQNLLVNLDSPINNPQNFYLYKDDAGRFNPIPWDLNESFGAFTTLQSGGQLQLPQLDPFVNLANSNYPIISKILSNTTYRKMYVAHMKTMIEENFSNNWYATRAQEIQGIIDAEVQADSNKFYTYSDFLNNINESVGGDNFGGGRPRPGEQGIVGISELMEARIDYLYSLSDFQAEAPLINNVSTTPENPSAHSTVWLTAEVSNAQTVLLAYRSSFSSVFQKTEMFDDGNHNDGAAGDGTYGVSLKVGPSGIQYYIYAENNDAATFLPARAENEFYSISAVGDVVINEFMADNETTSADPNGEYDDWIELYNNTSNDISLAGYFLSDDGNDLTQWAFPDTFIAANSFLIIWADKDSGQTGLHSNFKLSSSGEAIYLVSPDSQIVDEVQFDAQETDLSTGRYPNGTGTFRQMPPTFAATNQSGITGIQDKDFGQLPEEYTLEQNYPNPFNPSTNIVFSVPKSGNYSLIVYNMLGEEVAQLLNGRLDAGTQTLVFDGSNLSSGIYFYTLTGNGVRLTKKMMLMK